MTNENPSRRDLPRLFFRNLAALLSVTAFLDGSEVKKNRLQKLLDYYQEFTKDYEEKYADPNYSQNNKAVIEEVATKLGSHLGIEFKKKIYGNIFYADDDPKVSEFDLKDPLELILKNFEETYKSLKEGNHLPGIKSGRAVPNFEHINPILDKYFGASELYPEKEQSKLKKLIHREMLCGYYPNLCFPLSVETPDPATKE